MALQCGLLPVKYAGSWLLLPAIAAVHTFVQTTALEYMKTATLAVHASQLPALIQD